jgi:hypothetical protein
MNLVLPIQWIATSSATSATMTVTQAAPNTSATQKRHLVYGWTFSFSGGAPAAGTIKILDGASTVLDQVEIAAATSATPVKPILVDYAWPLPCTAGNSAQMTVTGLGAGVLVTGILRGRTESR